MSTHTQKFLIILWNKLEVQALCVAPFKKETKRLGKIVQV